MDLDKRIELAQLLRSFAAAGRANKDTPLPLATAGIWLERADRVIELMTSVPAVAE